MRCDGKEQKGRWSAGGIARDVTEQKRAQKLAQAAGDSNCPNHCQRRRRNCGVWPRFAVRRADRTRLWNSGPGISASAAVGELFREKPLSRAVRGHDPEYRAETGAAKENHHGARRRILNKGWVALGFQPHGSAA